MVAGDLVNTASRVQSAAEPGTVLVGEATRRATEAAIAFEEAGAHELKGKDGACRRSGGRCASSRASRGDAQVGRARGAVRRPRPRAAPDQGSLPRARPTSGGAPRLGHRHRRDRQVAARVGVRQVLRRARRARLLAPRPLPRLRRRASPTGRSRTWCGCAAGSPRTRTSRRALREAPRDARGARAGRGASARFVEPRLAQLLGLERARARPTGRTCSPPGGCSSSGWPRWTRRCSCSRTSSGPTRACSTSSSTCSTGRATTRSS